METQLKSARFDRPLKVNNIGHESDRELVDSSDEVKNDEIAAMDWVWKYSEYIPWAKNNQQNKKRRNSSLTLPRLTKYLIICWRKGKLR
jgi:hypothetical protein